MVTSTRNSPSVGSASPEATPDKKPPRAKKVTPAKKKLPRSYAKESSAEAAIASRFAPSAKFWESSEDKKTGAKPVGGESEVLAFCSKKASSTQGHYEKKKTYAS